MSSEGKHEAGAETTATEPTGWTCSNKQCRRIVPDELMIADFCPFCDTPRQEDEENKDADESWTCSVCTFVNWPSESERKKEVPSKLPSSRCYRGAQLIKQRCEMCGTSRHPAGAKQSRLLAAALDDDDDKQHHQ